MDASKPVDIAGWRLERDMLNCHNLLDLENLKTNLSGQRPRRSSHHSLPAWGVVSRLAGKLWNKPSMLVRALNAGTLLILDPRRYPEFYKPQHDRLGALVGKTPTPRAAEIGVRVR